MQFTRTEGVVDYKMYINGEWVESDSRERFESRDPFTGKVWATFPRGNADDADRAVAAAKRAAEKGAWASLNPTKRGHMLRRFADAIAENAERLAVVETRDNGKLINEMLAQVRYVPEFFYYFAGMADKLEGQVIPIDKADTFNFTRREPLGVCVAITAWNSPLLLAAYKLGPGLAAGNSFILKPSEFTSASAVELAKVAEEAGLPPGVLNVVTGFGAEVGAPLVEHPDVAKVAFTGSEFGGQKVYESAARGLKRVTLELGGKSPNIVFDDANLDNAVRGAISGIFAASGQTCVAGSRLLVQRSIYDDFVSRVVKFGSTARLGDPLDVETQVGPVTTDPQYRKILDYIDIAKDEGAQTLLGGGPADRPEFGTAQFVQPTIFGNVNNAMRIAREEVFGPVLSCIPFEDEEEALVIANDSPYALASGVWTNNLRRALLMSEKLQAGTVWVNMYRAISYMSPFGGHKRSGVGHENGLESIYDYTKTKSVWMSTSLETPDPFVIR